MQDNQTNPFEYVRGGIIVKILVKNLNNRVKSDIRIFRNRYEKAVMRMQDKLQGAEFPYILRYTADDYSLIFVRYDKEKNKSKRTHLIEIPKVVQFIKLKKYDNSEDIKTVHIKDVITRNALDLYKVFRYFKKKRVPRRFASPNDKFVKLYFLDKDKNQEGC